MLAHRVETTIGQDRKLTLENLPFHSGERVEVIILSQPQKASEQNRYPLRGTAIQYVAPTEPVAQDDWEVTQ
ncbi:hypothetical protein ACE1AT_12195 [Pelatocladus sp. BLCC-F211]|uniref:hypothetical protein n=1 Tax=Pelatocladus sp. BLCC-F211 TaxID=3342752 RepID=UPI000420DC35|nr:hypothetical protein AMR41_22590 [Hapalosiphon sp. MRB220]TBR57569.1 hypothetical protein B4U84_16410 [Westiellopsis prolifica IICB1]